MRVVRLNHEDAESASVFFELQLVYRDRKDEKNL
jgi:hypothetical protein